MNIGNNNINLNSKEIDKENFQKTINKIKKDGIVSPSERNEIFEIGKGVKDNTKFQELKQGIPLDYPEISKIFEEGFNSNAEKANIQEKTFNSVNEQIRNNAIKEQVMARKFASVLSNGVNSLSKSLENISKKNENDDPFISALKTTGKAISEATQSTGKFLKDLSLPDTLEKQLADSAKIVSNKISENYITKKVENIKNDYVKKEADMVTCVTDALKEIGFKDVKKEGVINIEESLLNKMTGVEWDAIEISAKKESDLRKLLKGEEGKALVSDGGHAYVFKGFTKEGDLLVKDATVNAFKTIKKNNVAATVYVQGSGDGNLTEKAKADRNVHLFSTINSLSNINSLDRDDKGNLNESWEIRKLFVLLSDPTKNSTVKEMAKYVKSNDIQSLNNLLIKNGIKIDEREVRAMRTILNANIVDKNGVVTTMMDKFVKFNSKTNGNLNMEQTNYLKAVEYSNVDLNNYFSSASNAIQRAQNMNKVFEEMIKGGEGC
ncbi:MAG: hypothetical protein KatS3mg068_1401 [Candidatus Sericytochromatia bacterium]|nr:MAG: hypothetical protein KatS3mg068_1401 [Candidatus Sericytochromatia bacterium]